MEKIEVYHAGTDRIESPDCLRGRRNLDFGRGFYITDVYDQAYNLALSRSRDRKMPALINKKEHCKTFGILNPTTRFAF